MHNFPNMAIGTSSQVLFLADLPPLLAGDDMKPQARRNMLSAINTAARVLEGEPASIPADATELRTRLEHADPGSHGIGPVRWRNVKSDLNRALRFVYGDERRVALSAAWLAVVAASGSPTDKSMMRRWGRFCLSRTVEPPAVTDEHLAGFIEHLEKIERSKSPARIAADTARLWNRLAASYSELALPPLTIVSRSHAYTLAWSDFPPSLEADVRAFCAPPSIANLFDIERDSRTFSAETSFAYERLLRRLATAEVRAGISAPSLTSLRELVDPSHLREGLAWLAGRNDGRPNVQLHNIAALSLTIARHWAKLDKRDIDMIEIWAKRFRPKRTGMTAKNRERLRQFTGGDVLAGLIKLPEQIFAELEGKPITPTAARLARDAIMVAVLTVAPMRLKNLRQLHRHSHFRPAFSIDASRWELVIPAAAVKNDIDLAYPVPAHIMTMIDRYMTDYQPVLAHGPSGLLFSGFRGSETFSEGGARAALKRLIERRLGITMNPHLFRHLDAWIFLKAHPGQYESVRQLLGHKNIQTTIGFYAGFETDEAMERFGSVLSAFRAEPDEG